MATVPLPSPSDFPSNSQSTRTPGDEESRDRLPKLISGSAIKKKESLWKRASASFTGDDAKSVGQYIFLDVMVPAFKTMISDAATQGVERMLFGDSRPRSSASRPGGSYAQYTAYNRPYVASREPQEMTRRGRATHDFREIVLENRQDAYDVIDALTRHIERYGVATVMDLYDSVGITGAYTDSKYGWTDLRGAGVERVREGFLVNVPVPEPIK